MRRIAMILALSATLGVVPMLASSGAVLAANGGHGASGWHLGYYTNSPKGTLSNREVAPGDGVATFDFTSQPNTALLVTNKSATGDETGKTVTATFTISGATSAFTYYGEGTASNPCPTPANVRLYFETSNAGGFAYTHYWWSNPASAVLANGTLSVTATIEPNEWSDWNGQPGSTQLAGFAAAASNITDIGLSFGGGCFFENGVGTMDGSGTFTLNSFSAS